MTKLLLPEALGVDLKTRKLKLVSASEIEDFVDLADEVSEPSWPEFMLHDEVANKHWYALNDRFADFQFALVDLNSKQWVAVGNSIPVCWSEPLEDLPDAGWDWALSSGMESTESPTVLCALAIQILPEFRGKGLSALMVKIMKEIGYHFKFDQLIAPVRPNKKCDYPLLPMEDYIEWSKGTERFDPWLRVHERLGAKLLKVCPEAMLISDTVEAWEQWTGMTFQSSGEYVIPGALSTVRIDVKANRGVYVEANVWMVHGGVSIES